MIHAVEGRRGTLSRFKCQITAHSQAPLISVTIGSNLLQAVIRNKYGEIRVMDKGVTKANEGINGQSWNVVGQTYVPKLLSTDAFVWDATLPADTFVPPHILSLIHI